MGSISPLPQRKRSKEQRTKASRRQSQGLELRSVPVINAILSLCLSGKRVGKGPWVAWMVDHAIHERVRCPFLGLDVKPNLQIPDCGLHVPLAPRLSLILPFLWLCFNGRPFINTTEIDGAQI